MNGTQLEQLLVSIDRQCGDIRRKLYSREVIDRLGFTPDVYPEFRSQYGEDMLAWEMLGKPLDGCIVEAGAFDGKSLSVSYAFDSMGWHCVLVEPIPEVYSALVTNRLYASTIRCALGATDCGYVEFDIVDGAGMFSGATSNHKIDERLSASRKEKRRIAVEQLTLDTVLEKSHVTDRVDVAVIDVEGGECEVLKGFDMERWRPRVVIIEDNSFGEDKSMDQYFEKSYQFYATVGCNRVYGRKDDPVVWRYMNPMA